MHTFFSCLFELLFCISFAVLIVFWISAVATLCAEQVISRHERIYHRHQADRDTQSAKE